MTQHHVHAQVAYTSESTGLRYTRRGKGQPVLLLHGWCLNKKVWLYLEQALLEQGRQVLSVDLAGFGESENLSGPYTFERHAEDIEQLVAELQLRDVVAVGFAYGAAVLMHVQNDTAFSGFVSIGIPSASHADYPRMQKAMKRDWPRFAQASARAICSQTQSDETLTWLGDIFASTHLEVALKGADALAGFEPNGHSIHWTKPSLFIHGENDPVVPVSVSAACVEDLSDAELVIVLESGHFVPFDQPHTLAETILDFTKRLAGVGDKES